MEVAGVNLNLSLSTLSGLPLARLMFFWSTRTLLADIAAARGRPVPDSPTNPFSPSTSFKPLPPSLWDSQPLNYPFNLLTRATIPTSLNKYLKFHHPSPICLASPRLQHLPKKLSPETYHGPEANSRMLRSGRQKSGLKVLSVNLWIGSARFVVDFSPDVKHVFIGDEARNMVDFSHRAGRSGRAGRPGKVVVFARGKGGESDGAREIRRKVGELSSH